MNKQTKKLLLKFSNTKKVYNTEDINLKSLSNEFSVSERTIRNYIDSVNMFLKNHNLAPLVIIENGVIINSNSPFDIQKSLEKFNLYNYRLSKNERKKVITLMLLLSNDYITFSYISKILYFSRVTIINDVNILKDEIFNGELKIKSKPNKGLYVVGPEALRRNIAMEIISSDLYYLEMINSLNICLKKYKNKDCFNTIFKSIVEELEIKFNMYFSEKSVNILFFYMYLLMIRNEYSDSSMFCEFIESSKYSEFSENLIKLMCEYFNLRFKNIDYEISYLSKVLSDFKYINLNKNKNVIEVQMITKKFIKEISDEMSNNLESDFEFYKNLSNHINSIMNEDVQELDMDVMVVFQDILTNHSYVFNVIKKKIVIIEEYFNRQLEEIELYYIVIHVLAAIERERINRVDLNVLLLCNYGVGTSQLLKARIKKHFEFRILKVISLQDFIDFDFRVKNFDLIITTIEPDRFLKDYEYIKISPILSDTDVVMIENRINELQNVMDETIHNSYSLKENFLSNEQVKKLSHKISNDIKKSIKSNSKKEFIDMDFYKIVYTSIVNSMELSKNYENSNNNNNKDSQPKLSELLTEKSMYLDIDVNNLVDAIVECGKILVNEGSIKNEYIDAMIENIKENGDYVMISDKFILPHAGISSGSIKTSMAFIRLKNEIPFSINSQEKSEIIEFNMEEKKMKNVKFICCLSAIDKHTHLKSLFSLINLLNMEEFKSMLYFADKEEIIEFIKKHE